MCSNSSGDRRARVGRALGALGWLGSLGPLVPLAGCGREPPPAPLPLTRFEDAPCAFEVPDGRSARCGWLHVAENRGDPATRFIRVPVAVLATPAAERLPDPVVLLSGGGPGGAIGLGPDRGAWHFRIHDWVYYSEADPGRGRDLILLEQRGAGLSEPELDCPEGDALGVEALASGWSGPELIERSRQAAQRCRERLVASGVDLRGYTTAASAADAEDLRRALGIERWNLYGVSYGTRIALALLRDHPGAVRSAVLDSPLPLDLAELEELPAATDRAFAALFASCADTPACRAAFPRLEQRLDAELRRLAASPRRVRVRSPAGGEVAVQVDAGRFVRCLLLGMYRGSLWPSLPREIVTAGDPASDGLARCAEDLLDNFADPRDEFSSGLFYTVACADELPWNDAERSRAARERFPRYAEYHAEIDAGMRAACEAWGVPPSPERERLATASDVPVLLLSGAWDPVVPPSWARRAAAFLPRAQLFEFAETPHGVIGHEPCAERVAGVFLDDPAQRPAPRCLDAERTPRLAHVEHSADRAR